ncbi:MAG TPA: type IV pilus assembly protein PilM [Pirellulales bacterium]|nr:type IV pilus assembly protein PilM [Pirellulales bacterium]
MARSDAVWGIDIGQCALKALRCRPGGEPSQVLADAFDYVEYPKILSQPEADPAALVQEAITQFLSRNSVRGDRVAVSVPGQSGLARFIKLPPVEAKKIPDIVKYEARQQIPFSLEDVVWDYQKMVGGSEEEGFALETEVGLFAMKRDQVYRALKPFIDSGIEVDVVQLTPLALYNFVVFDQMQDLPPPADYDPDNPPPSTVLLSLGTDSTDLVVTNGFRVWQRSVPIGGNHFTKALTKELKLTFATAEHLKRNAAKADDPKALFQAMRPVFNDLLTEVQRSIGYFSNIDRRAKIGRVLGLGNAMKLPGLQRYLAQNLGNEFNRLETFRGLTGPSVVDAPAFKENVASFGVCYGLALQGLKESAIRTNLLPREIMKDRMIRAKKPWAVGAAAALLLGCTISYFGYWRAWNAVLQDNYFAPAVARANDVVSRARGYESSYTKAKDDYKKMGDVGQSLVPSAERRERWLEVWKALNLALPKDEGDLPADVTKRKSLNILSVQAQHLDDVTSWYTSIKEFDKAEPKAPPPPPPPPADGAEATPPPPEPTPEPEVTGPSGPGWIISLRGYHFHNDRVHLETSKEHYVRQTIIRNLKSGKLTIPEEDRVPDGPSEIDLKKIGLLFPVVVPASGARTYEVFWENKIEGADDGPNVEGAAGQAKQIPAPRFDFFVELCWLDEPPQEEPPPPAEEGAAPVEPADAAPPPAVATPAPTPEESPPAEGAPAAASPMPAGGEPAPAAPPGEAPTEPPAAPAGEAPPAAGEAPAGESPAPPASPPAGAPPAAAPNP